MEPLRNDAVAVDYEEDFNRDEREIAAERDCEVVYSDETTLQLDLDSDADLELFYTQHMRMLDAGMVGPIIGEWASRSGNTHIVVELPEPAPVETRIMLQALLGSDRVRELLNLRRHRAGITNPIRLFRPLQKEPPSAYANWPGWDLDEDLIF